MIRENKMAPNKLWDILGKVDIAQIQEHERVLNDKYQAYKKSGGMSIQKIILYIALLALGIGVIQIFFSGTTFISLILIGFGSVFTFAMSIVLYISTVSMIENIIWLRYAEQHNMKFDYKEDRKKGKKFATRFGNLFSRGTGRNSVFKQLWGTVSESGVKYPIYKGRYLFEHYNGKDSTTYEKDFIAIKRSKPGKTEFRIGSINVFRKFFRVFSSKKNHHLTNPEFEKKFYVKAASDDVSQHVPSNLQHLLVAYKKKYGHIIMEVYKDYILIQFGRIIKPYKRIGFFATFGKVDISYNQLSKNHRKIDEFLEESVELVEALDKQ